MRGRDDFDNERGLETGTISTALSRDDRGWVGLLDTVSRLTRWRLDVFAVNIVFF